MDGNLNLLTQMRYVANWGENEDLGSDLTPVGPVLVFSSTSNMVVLLLKYFGNFTH